MSADCESRLKAALEETARLRKQLTRALSPVTDNPTEEAFYEKIERDLEIEAAGKPVLLKRAAALLEIIGSYSSFSQPREDSVVVPKATLEAARQLASEIQQRLK